MAKSSPIQSSFNAGELSPQLKGRADLDKYRNGGDLYENFLPQIHGPIRKRPGTRFVNEIKDSSKPGRLIPFEFSTEQAYILEFGDRTLRFYVDGGILLDSMSVIYEIATPYDADDLMGLDFAQSADVVYITHPDYPVYKLSRFAPTNWTIVPIVFNWPPFSDENTTATTITASAVSGASVTLTASASLFEAADVGRFVRLAELAPAKHNPWAPGQAITAGQTRIYLGNVYEATNSATTGARPPIHTKGTESDGVVNWVFLHDGAGYAQITAFTSATVVTASVIRRFPSTAATDQWSFGAWSAKSGYPRCVTFYEDRLWFAGTQAQPQTLWASTTGDYENFKLGTNDDDALNYTINTQDSNTILWTSAGKVLALGTANGEFTISATQISDPVTPTNVSIKPQTNYGSAQDIRPLRIGSSILFVQRANRRLREYTYDFNIDGFVAQNLTVLAEHITKNGVVDLAYQQEPGQVVWAPTANGELLGMTYERAEDVVGWHRHPNGGVVESVAVIPHWDGDQDVMFAIVRRVIDGDTVRYIEYLEKYLTGEYQFYVDSGLTYDGVPATTISGLDHLEGEEVAILADGAVHPRRTVTAGAVTLQAPASVVNVGLPYKAVWQGMPIEAGARDGIAQGKTMRVNNIVMRLFDTGPGLFYGPDEDHMDELHPRNPNMPMNAPVPSFTGDTTFLPWPGEYQQSPQLRIEHRLPTSCTIVALMPQLNTYDR